jgi:hypothetical protein
MYRLSTRKLCKLWTTFITVFGDHMCGQMDSSFIPGCEHDTQLYGKSALNVTKLSQSLTLMVLGIWRGPESENGEKNTKYTTKVTTIDQF